jgi:hypothetical protein
MFEITPVNSGDQYQRDVSGKSSCLEKRVKRMSILFR